MLIHSHTASLLPVEAAVLKETVCRVTEFVTSEDVTRLLDSGNYRPSLGNPPQAQHYRRSMIDGTCLHLIVENEIASLHCDRFDPHRSPMSLVFHLLTESRHELIGNSLAGWVLTRMLRS